MDKYEADRIIEGYVKKLFGFAVSKLSDIHEAEELAEDIVLTVYESLLLRENIENVNGYIYKVACNVYARYIDKKNKHLRVDGIEYIPDGNDIELEVIESEQARLLRREITYLSEMQRKIVVMHYFHDMKIREIARTLVMSESTVKWYLACSRKELGIGMENKRTIGELGIRPIKLCNMGHNGHPGALGDTEDFLKNSLTQNIVYCAYHEPKTINEIAEELGVNPIFIRDEVDYLEEYGFMDKLSNGRYRTNVLIYQPTDEKIKAENELALKYAEIFTKEYFSPVLSQINDIPDWLTLPDNDINLLKWSLVPFMSKKLRTAEITDKEFSVKRKDGGDYVATASLETDTDIHCNDDYNDMWRNNDSVPFLTENKSSKWTSWQFNSHWDSRIMDWRDNRCDDFDKLYYYLCGELKYNELNISAYQRLLDKGYLIKNGNDFKINVILSYSIKKWYDFITPASEKLIEISKEYAKQKSELDICNQPQFMHKLIKYYGQNAACLLHTRVMKLLLDMGVLNEPSEEQRKGLCTVMFLGE
ncbi:MAG: sigma-70 family RNA polymerase sigma factor [Ruminococcaceae bacterium]|nr:sigma-70 family RNA polymerase sigma factor [Oscillospiraceae bacterium]MBD5117252.1 sigma-70 family RNA polymerase sigma factor [Oscillospiraceae bacterium]